MLAAGCAWRGMRVLMPRFLSNTKTQRSLYKTVHHGELITLFFNYCADVPYDLTPKFLEELLTKHKIDYVIHGDDPCILPGAAPLSAAWSQQASAEDAVCSYLTSRQLAYAVPSCPMTSRPSCAQAVGALPAMCLDFTTSMLMAGCRRIDRLT